MAGQWPDREESEPAHIYLSLHTLGYPSKDFVAPLSAPATWLRITGHSYMRCLLSGRLISWAVNIMHLHIYLY